jgi:hypothetical protein
MMSSGCGEHHRNRNQRQETDIMTYPADPFQAPATIPSSFPTIGSLRGRLVLITPLKQETRPNNLGAPGATQQVITADVDVVDGRGPVPVVRGNPPIPTGQMLEGPSFTGMWITNEVVVTQLQTALRTGGKVLARVDTKVPGTNPGKGNAWGLIDPTEADKQTARDFLAGRTIANTTPPQPAPVQVQISDLVRDRQPAPVQAQTAPQSAPQPGTNPFA